MWCGACLMESSEPSSDKRKFKSCAGPPAADPALGDQNALPSMSRAPRTAEIVWPEDLGAQSDQVNENTTPKCDNGDQKLKDGVSGSSVTLQQNLLVSDPPLKRSKDNDWDTGNPVISWSAKSTVLSLSLSFSFRPFSLSLYISISLLCLSCVPATVSFSF